jgi:CheY-like chemotaxis protein
MSNLTQWRVLVIEDEDDSMELVQGVLGYYGIPSTGAGSSEEALTMLDEINPTLVIVDLNLPGIDGWRFLHQVRQNARYSSVPFVAMTAYHSAEMAEQAIEAGFSAYFIKPIDATSFVRELEGIVG